MLALLYVIAGVRAICLRLPESTVVGVSHNFSRKQGLSDPSRMRQWMEPAGTISSSSSTVSDRSNCCNKSQGSSTESLRDSLLSETASAACNDETGVGETGVTVTVCLKAATGSEKGAAAAAHSDAVAPAVEAIAAAPAQ